MENADENIIKAIKISIIRTLPSAIFDAEPHVTARHINKTDMWLMHRLQRMASSQANQSEKATSSFENTDFFSAALLTVRAILSSNEALEEIACAFALMSQSRPHLIIIPMPDNIQAKGFRLADGRIEEIECHRIRVVLRRTPEFLALLENAPQEISQCSTCCTVLTFYPIR